MHIATSLGRRFSVIVGREKWIPQMYENVVRCGFADRISSFETIGSRPHDLQADKQETERRLTAAARRAIDDKRAEVIILGGTLEFGFYRQLQEKLSVPVIDSLIASVKYAELMVDLRRDFNWATSRKYSFESPPQQELRDFKIEEQYSISRATKNSSTMLTSET